MTIYRHNDCGGELIVRSLASEQPVSVSPPLFHHAIGRYRVPVIQ